MKGVAESSRSFHIITSRELSSRARLHSIQTFDPSFCDATTVESSQAEICDRAVAASELDVERL